MDYKWNIVDIFNVDQINQWYSSKHEASCHFIYFTTVHQNKYFQMYSREVWTRNDQISKKDPKQCAKIAKVKCEPKVFKF